MQQTLRNSVRATGVALHTGRKVNVSLHPGEVDTGVVFKRTDLPGGVLFPASASRVGNTQMATSLCSGDEQLSTIEHLMSALSGLGIDNVVVEVDGGELPIMDSFARRP